MITSKSMQPWIIILLISISILFAGCESTTQLGNTPPLSATSPAYSENIPVQTPSSSDVPANYPPTEEIQPAIEITENPPPLVGNQAQLAYLTNGNLWLIDVQHSGEAQQLTFLGDLLSFAWSPDSNQLATFNGHNLCLIYLDGSSANCIDLDLDENQAQIFRKIVWSPDMRSIVLWNPINPWDEFAIGWLIVSLDQTYEPIKILDPVDWGAEIAPDNEPGGVTGEALYLKDGTLVGTITHRWLCGESGCHYQLYIFDILSRTIQPYPNKPEDGFSEGMGLVLSNDGGQLLNFGTFHTGCEAFITFMDLYDINTGTRNIINYPQVAVNAVTLSPDGQLGVIAHNAGCSTQNQNQWAQTCGLSAGFDVFPMQLIDTLGLKLQDLPPGLQPTWSPDGANIAFRSCLTSDGSGAWSPTSEGPPGLYKLELSTGTINRIADGEMPQWKP